MTYSYPVVFTPIENGTYAVYVPDLGIHTQGLDLQDARDMAADAIFLWIQETIANNEPVPLASQPGDVASSRCELVTVTL